jgi:hypothetical protein
MRTELETAEAVRYRKIQEARRRMARAGIGRRPETKGEWSLTDAELDRVLGDSIGGLNAYQRQQLQERRTRRAMDRT